MATIENNENLNICGTCGGECCKTKPGIDSPESYLSVDDPAALLAEKLSSGHWVLDRHYGLPAVDGRPAIPAAELLLYYPRPALRKEYLEGIRIGEGGTGDCVLLGEEGCTLSFDERPFMCRALEPDEAFECTSPWDRRDAAVAWYPHQGLVREAMRRAGIRG